MDATGKTFTAPILSVVAAADAASRTSNVKLGLSGIEGLKPGEFAKVRFQALGGESLAVPAEALVHQGQMDGVYVTESGVARLRWIQIGRTSDGYVQVLAGLRKGDAVINPIPPGLRDGTPVEVSR
jgi:membrane fusion protein (multidrug efflux system)